MGVAPRRVRDPGGREWVVRVYRYRMPPWRNFAPVFDEDGDPLFWFVGLVLAFLSAVFTVVVFPLLVFLVELPVSAARALFADARWVEATSSLPQPIRMTWRTDSAHVDAVTEQAVRQLGLGYDRVRPHNAVFEGFA